MRERSIPQCLTVCPCATISSLKTVYLIQKDPYPGVYPLEPLLLLTVRWRRPSLRPVERSVASTTSKSALVAFFISLDISTVLFSPRRYSPSVRAQVGRYALHHGVAEAARYFSRKLGHRLSKTTVASLKKAYVKGVRENRAEGESVDLATLPPKKRGRRVLLGDDLDKKVQMYLRKLREGGGVVSARIAVAAARGIVHTYNKSLLAEFGGHIELTTDWAYSLFRRMTFVKRKVTTAKSKHPVTEFNQLKERFLAEVVETVQMEEIPPELILNLDQTGIKIVPSSTWTMEQQGTKRVELVGENDKRLITAVFCGSLVGDFLPLQIIYAGKTERCHPHYEFPTEWDITHSPKHWSNESTMIQYFTNIIIPYVDKTRESFEEDTPALIIMDNFKAQITSSVNRLLEENSIHVCLLPANTTDRLQPMDISVNKPAKEFLKRCFSDWYSEQIQKQLEGCDIESTELQPVDLSLPRLKELGAKWMVEMSEYLAENPQIIVNGFIKSGIAGALDGEKEQQSDITDCVNSDEYESDFDEHESDFEGDVDDNGDEMY